MVDLTGRFWGPVTADTPREVYGASIWIAIGLYLLAVLSSLLEYVLLGPAPAVKIDGGLLYVRLFSSVLFAPLLENALILMLDGGLGLVITSDLVRSILIGVAAMLAHAPYGPKSPFIFFAFFVMAHRYSAISAAFSVGVGYVAITIIHSTYNFLLTMTAVLPQILG